NSDKGNFSYNFFKLEKLSVHTYNQAQGIYSDEDQWLGKPEFDDDEDNIAETFHEIENSIELFDLKFKQK
ncbi:hypothetical protein, partial [Klebsiella michiganensis]